MNKKLTAFSIILPLLLIGFTNGSFANKINPPAGQTGAPSEPSCGFSGSTNSCHATTTTGPNASTLLALNTDLELLVGGVAVSNGFQYTPDVIYDLTFKINNPTELCGFSLTVKNDNTGLSGDLGIPTGSNAKFQISNSSPNPNYINHNGQAGISSWDFKWSAPAAGNGDVTFYASANKSNKNNNNNGDKIIPFKLEMTENKTTAINSESLKKAISINGNPILNNTLNFDLFVKETKKYSITVYDLSGKIVYTENETYSPGFRTLNINLEKKGMYILNIKTDKNESSSFKIIN